MNGVKNIGYMIPLVLLLVLIEWLISRLRGKKVYQFSDTITNMCCGILERLFDLFFVVILYFLFEFIYENITIYKIPFNGFTWILGLFVADFLAYWHHRLSHEVNFLWAAHIVHHQSEELNLSTVLRVSSFAVVNRAFFFIWLPIFGFSPALSTSVIIFIGLFQFLTHTRLIGRLVYLEKLFVTPSSHRVHHACNPKYIDKNYGHVFIIWDRMLNTYKPEEEEPVYGISSGFRSSNAYWAYLSYWKRLFSESFKLNNWKDKIWIFIKSPSKISDNPLLTESRFESNNSFKRVKYKLNVPVELQAYILLNFAMTMMLFMILLFNKASFSMLIIAQLIAGIAFSVLTIGVLMEQKVLGWRLELIRIILFSIAAFILFIEFNYKPILLALIASQGVFFLWVYKLKYLFKSKA